MITREELIKMLSDVESQSVERTESINNMDKFCQAICAFSNDVSGNGKNGYLIIGAKDNGELSGLNVDDKLLLQVANIRIDGNILPQPLMSVEKFSFDNGDVLVAEGQISIGITLDGIKYHIKNMTKQGLIKHEGPTKLGKWIIL